jgi:Ribbon-helix-helix domain
MGRCKQVTAIDSKRQQVAIDREQYIAVREYSDLTGVPVSVLVRRAMADYIENVLGAKMETLAAQAAGDQRVTGSVPIAPSPAYTAADAISDAPVLEAHPQAAEAIVPDEPSWVTNSEERTSN